MTTNDFDLIEQTYILIDILTPYEHSEPIVFSNQSIELIKQISEYAENTKLYKESKDKAYIFDDCTAEQVLYILLQKIINAPTSLHMNGAVILLMPILNKKLRKD